MNEFDGLHERVAKVEANLENVQDDVRELRYSDVKDIKRELRELHNEFTGSQRGMTRTEKMMFSGIVITAISAIVAVIALLAQGPAA